MPTSLGTVIAGTWTHRADTSPTRAGGPDHRRVGPHRPQREQSPPSRPSSTISPAVANGLAADGIATLRTDKPGSGSTGAGNLTPTIGGGLTVDDYLTMNAELLTFVASEPREWTPTRLARGRPQRGAPCSCSCSPRAGTASPTVFRR